MRISLLGPPGSGKGIYAEKLGKDFRVPVISVGNILREEVENKTEIGKKIENSMKKGNLVPDELVLKLVNDRAGKKEDIIFDGFPRTIKQINVDIDLIVSLTCSDKVCIKRIKDRRICEKCNKIYNILTLKPKKKGICDVCGGKLVSRNDQGEDVIKDRLRIFRKETLPVIEYFKKKGNLDEINAERSVDDIYLDIRKLFKPKK